MIIMYVLMDYWDCQIMFADRKSSIEQHIIHDIFLLSKYLPVFEQKRTRLRYRFCDNFTLRTIIARQLRNVAYRDTVDLNVDIGRGSIFITGVNIDVISKRPIYSMKNLKPI